MNVIYNILASSIVHILTGILIIDANTNSSGMMYQESAPDGINRYRF